ncbi:hypothetical protein DSECCO2_469580 [anaerobic digester metagenome]
MVAHVLEPGREPPAGVEKEFESDLDPGDDAPQARGQVEGGGGFGKIEGNDQSGRLHRSPHCRPRSSRQARRYAGLVFSAT